MEVVVEAEAVDTFWRDLIKSSKRFSASVEAVLLSASSFLTSIALAPSVAFLGGCFAASLPTASTVCSDFF